MAETNFRILLVAGTIFSILFFGIYNLISNVQTANSDFVQGEELTHFKTSFDKLEGQRNNITAMAEGLKNVEKTSGIGILSLPLAFLSSAWTSVKILFNSLSIFPDLFTSMFGYFGGISWIYPFLLTLIGIVVIFGILNFMFGRND